MTGPSPYDVELLLAAELAAITDAQQRAIVEAWLLAWSEISADLLDTLTTILADGTRVTAATIVRSERLAAVLAGVADRLDDLTAAAGVTITTALADVLTQAVDGTAELIAAQLDQARRTVDLDRQPVPAELEAIIERTTEQIASTLNPISDETYVLVQRELIRGVAAGDNPRETAQRMVDRAENQFNFGRSRALNVARTETLDAYRAGAEASQAVHADVLAGWVWLAHLTSRTCRSCLAMHGTLHALDEAGPKDHQQGRCARTPVVKPLDPDAEPDLSWVPDADAHFERLDATDQRALLGLEGYRAWLAGDFPREAWTKTRSADGWRDAQVPARPGEAAGGSGRGSDDTFPATAPDDGPARVLPYDEDFTYDGNLGRVDSKTAPITADLLRKINILAPSEDPDRYFSDNERAAADWLRDRGLGVRSVADADDLSKTPDAVLDDFDLTVEIKTLERATEVAVRNAINAGRRQAERVLVDGRSAALDRATAAAGIARVLGAAGLNLLEIVVILGDGTGVGWARG